MSTYRAESGFGPTTETALFRQAQAGCSESMNRLMARHHGLVHAVVRQQVLGDLPFGEALQDCSITSPRPIPAWKPLRGPAAATVYLFPEPARL
jgi:hypothetical protein